MEIRFLGTHNLASRDTRLLSLLIDGVLALDGGSLTSALTLEEQEGVSSILLSHRHYDHLRELPNLFLNTLDNGSTVTIFALEDTLHHLSHHLLDGSLYPPFTRTPSPEAPKARLMAVRPGEPFAVLDYTALALPVDHGPPSVGYYVSRGGRGLFYSGDTRGHLQGVWERVLPDLLVIEVTFPNRLQQMALTAGHLTPNLLERELQSLKEARGAVPPVFTVHMNPVLEGEIKEELGEVARHLGAEIALATEGMRVEL